ncbi:hypothetical protein [Actomonas aquatica]|uniref:Addiction module protein n=1 Tax=Actomonas aquatica TaxID=2866162 RepID=A0ABZ1C7L9_9BACT|nr:hypothetical protein [Opitutus sp. WL0086]WRQ87263.1 hypothetical protein K1X11_020815 [Opitutus sp. WL0086]
MSFNEVMAELPSLSFEERQTLIRHAIELDELPFSPVQEQEIERRRNVHAAAPESAIPAAEMKNRLRQRLEQ